MIRYRRPPDTRPHAAAATASRMAVIRLFRAGPERFHTCGSTLCASTAAVYLSTSSSRVSTIYQNRIQPILQNKTIETYSPLQRQLPRRHRERVDQPQQRRVRVWLTEHGSYDLQRPLSFFYFTALPRHGLSTLRLSRARRGSTSLVLPDASATSPCDRDR